MEMTIENRALLTSRRYPDFNSSLLMFLLKKPVDVIDGAAIFEPSGVRPLNITNTDNRLLASTVRIAVEPVLGPLITSDQMGLLE